MTSWWSDQEVLCCCATVVLCVALLLTGSGQVSGAMDGVEAIQVEGRLGWIIRLPDGRLMSWWTSGGTESGEDAESVEKAFARYSSDDGYTWSEPEVLFEFPKSEGSYIGDTILVDRDGAIHLFGLHFFGSYGLWVSPVWHVMSSDGGKTWTAPQDVPFGHEYCGCMNHVIQLSSGRIVLPIGYKSSRPHGWFDLTFALSDDGGKTWRPSREEPSLDHVSIDEGVGVELKDGRLWMLLRTGHQGCMYEAFSPDGETWTKAQPTRFVAPSAPAGAVRLRDGRIVIAWTNSLYARANRLVLAAAISDDEGKTWQGYREIARTRAATGRPWACYPWLTETTDGHILMTYHGEPKAPIGKEGKNINMVRFDPDWLTETTFRDDFSEGLANWFTLRTEGATVVAHPNAPERQKMRLRKPNADVAAGGSLNFPFGAQGELTMKLLLQPGFQGARICLTDYLTWPHYAEDGRFGISIAADGQISVGTGEGAVPIGDEIEKQHSKCDFTPTDVVLEAGKWHTVGFAWDSSKGTCRLTVNHQHIADLPQLSEAPGVCYLRLLSTAERTDRAGLALDSVSVTVKP